MGRRIDFIHHVEQRYKNNSAWHHVSSLYGRAVSEREKKIVLMYSNVN